MCVIGLRLSYVGNRDGFEIGDLMHRHNGDPILVVVNIMQTNQYHRIRIYSFVEMFKEHKTNDGITDIQWCTNILSPFLKDHRRLLKIKD